MIDTDRPLWAGNLPGLLRLAEQNPEQADWASIVRLANEVSEYAAALQGQAREVRREAGVRLIEAGESYTTAALMTGMTRSTFVNMVKGYPGSIGKPDDDLAVRLRRTTAGRRSTGPRGLATQGH